MNWKLKHIKLKVLLLPVFLPLAACSGWNADGVRTEPLPQNVVDPCDHPLEVIREVRGTTVGSDEVRIGRLGDALIECGQEKQIAVESYAELSELIE